MEAPKHIQSRVLYCSHLLVGAEDVERQRLLPVVDEADSIVHVAHGYYRQQGAKDLLLHQPGVWGHVLQHSWCYRNIVLKIKASEGPQSRKDLCSFLPM